MKKVKNAVVHEGMSHWYSDGDLVPVDLDLNSNLIAIQLYLCIIVFIC